MIKKNKNGLEWWEFSLLQGFPVAHGVFTRLGGVSEGSYASLNVGGNSGDTEENVTENRERIRNTMSINVLQNAHQCHQTDISIIDSKNQGHAQKCDAMLTATPSVGLMIKHADCQATILYDKKQHVLAVVHCGWRGNVSNIYAHTVSKMLQTYNSHPADILACIGPSLGPQHAEFIHHKTELPAAFQLYQVRENYFDFWAISRDQLLALGILQAHIECAEHDTYSSDLFFSHRGQKGITGRNATVAALN